MRFLILLLAMGVCVFQACAVVSTGHVVPLEKLADFKPGETSSAEVLAALGAPENVAENTADHTLVYAYQWVTDRFIGAGLPPFLIFGRKSDNGFQLNVAFAGGIYHGYTLTRLGQNLFWRGAQGPAEAESGVPAAEKETAEFGDPRKIKIEGYDGTAMEPFISRDGKYLFFNNSNDPPEKTDLFYARRLDDLRFRFLGEVRGANSPALDAVPSLDESGRFYFTTTRSYAENFQTIYSGAFRDGVISDVSPVGGNFSHKKPGWVTMDAEISSDGRSLYFSDAFFIKGPVPASSHLGVAFRDASGDFLVPSNAREILHNLHSQDLEYAPCTSRDGLELFFTRMTPKTLRARILRARRKSVAAPFEAPEVISAITGFSEAPSISSDGRVLYYHKKEGSKYSIYRVIRD